MKTVLVTGGSGNLGKVIVKELIRHGYEPYILSSKTHLIAPTGCTVLYRDLTDQRSLPKINTDVIIHLFKTGINLCPENRYGSIRWKDFVEFNYKLII